MKKVIVILATVLFCVTLWGQTPHEIKIAEPEVERVKVPYPETEPFAKDLYAYVGECLYDCVTGGIYYVTEVKRGTNGYDFSLKDIKTSTITKRKNFNPNTTRYIVMAYFEYICKTYMSQNVLVKQLAICTESDVYPTYHTNHIDFNTGKPVKYQWDDKWKVVDIGYHGTDNKICLIIECGAKKTWVDIDKFDSCYNSYEKLAFLEDEVVPKNKTIDFNGEPIVITYADYINVDKEHFVLSKSSIESARHHAEFGFNTIPVETSGFYSVTASCYMNIYVHSYGSSVFARVYCTIY